MPLVLKSLNQLTCPEDARLFDILDTSLGTLWWVREDVWQSKIHSYDRRSTRDSHPGLSVDESKPDQRKSYAQMIHGRSDRRGSSFCVCGLTKRERDRIAYFGQIHPVPIDARLFTRETTALRPDDPDWTGRVAIVANNYKPRLTPDEHEEFVRWWEVKRERQRKHHAP